MGQGGEIYVLEMGDPIRILQLAEDMITLSGLRPGADIEIIYTGIRPGEKLFEELAISGEDVSPTKHPKIGIWRRRREDWDQLCEGIRELLILADGQDESQLRAKLGALVPEYEPAPHGADELTATTADQAVGNAPLPEVGGSSADPALGM
jgi:FlaA1/EpsC-like NDP-sugar epimerase